MLNNINMMKMKSFSFCYFLPQTLPIGLKNAQDAQRYS